MTRGLIPAICFVLVLISSSIVAAQAPQPFTASYLVSTDKYDVGKATLSLEKQGDLFQMELLTEATGLFSLLSGGNSRETSTVSIKQTSAGQISVLPQRYSTFNKKAKPGRNLEAEFLPAAKLISIVSDGKDESVLKTSGDVQDPLSSMLLTMQLLQDDMPDALTLSIFNRGVVKESHFEFSNASDVETPAGNYETVRVTRKHGSSERETHIWYADKLGFVPIKIEQYKRGELVARLALKSIQQ